MLQQLWGYLTYPNLPVADYLQDITGVPTLMIPCHCLRISYDTKELIRTLFRSLHGEMDLFILLGQNDVARFAQRSQTGLLQMQESFSLYLDRRFADLHNLFSCNHLAIRTRHIVPFEDRSLDYPDSYLSLFQILSEKIASFADKLHVGPFDEFLPDRWHLPCSARYKLASQIACAIG